MAIHRPSERPRQIIKWGRMDLLGYEVSDDPDVIEMEIGDKTKGPQAGKLDEEFIEVAHARTVDLLEEFLPKPLIHVLVTVELIQTPWKHRGKMDEVFYDGEHGSEIARFTLDVRLGHYGMSIPRGMWHSVEVHEPTVIVEMKDGPYVPR